MTNRNVLGNVPIYMALCSLFAICARGAEMKTNYPKDTIEGKVFYRYPVERSIGLYRISVNFGVSQEEIIKYNPEVKETGLRYGETVLLIPTGEVVTPTEKKIAPKPKIADSAVVVAARSTPKKYKEYKLPATVNIKDEMLDFLQADTADTVHVEKVQTRSLNRTVMRKVGVLLPLPKNTMEAMQESNIFLEFYLGVLLGSKHITSSDYQLDLRIFDIGRGVSIIDNLLANGKLDSLDALLGPVYSEQVSYLAKWVKERKIPLIIPFADNLDNIRDNPYLYQFNMSEKLKVYTILRYLKDRRDSIHCVFLYADGLEGLPMATSLKKKVYSHYISYNEVSVRQVVHDSLRYYLEPNKHNIIVLNTERYNEAKLLFPSIKSATKTYNISILGEYSWSEYDIDVPMLYCSIFTDKFRKFHTHYDSLYSRYFGQAPQSKLLRYDLLGYDLICHLATILDSVSYQPLQSEIRFRRLKEGSGFINRNVKVIEKQ